MCLRSSLPCSKAAGQEVFPCLLVLSSAWLGPQVLHSASNHSLEMSYLMLVVVSRVTCLLVVFVHLET